MSIAGLVIVISSLVVAFIVGFGIFVDDCSLFTAFMGMILTFFLMLAVIGVSYAVIFPTKVF